MCMQASNVTVGATALATSSSLQLTATLINSISSDKLCCLGQAFSAIVDAEIADGSIGVRVRSFLQHCYQQAAAVVMQPAVMLLASAAFGMGWLVHGACTGSCTGCSVPC